MKNKQEFPTQYYSDVVQNSVAVDDSDLAKIKSYFSEDSNSPFQPDEIAVFEGWISNNIIDRSMNRLPLDTLQSLTETIVGKPKLVFHDVNEIPDGKFFKSRLEKVDIDTAMRLIGAVPYKKKDFRKILEISNEKDGGLYWLVATFYMLQGTPEEKNRVRKVRAGLLKDMSLSFYVPKRVAILENDNEVEVDQWFHENMIDGEKVLYYEWRNADNIKAEAVEASHVFLGRLRGTISQQTDDPKNVNDNYKLIINHYDIKKLNQNPNNSSDLANIRETDIKIDNSETIPEQSDLIENAEWSTAYINSLEDNCFAVVENTGEKDEEGKTVPRSARHLPHHPKGKGDSGAGGTLDMAHFRNALARLNQIKPVTKTISREGLIEKARKHLAAHSAKLEKEKSKEKASINQETKKMEIQLFGSENTITILPDSLEEDVTRLMQEVNQKIEGLTSENAILKKNNDTLKSENDGLKKSQADYKQIFGEMTLNQLAQMKSEGEILRNFLIQETLTFKRLAGLKVEENSAESFGKMSVETIMEMLKEFRNQMANKPGYGWLSGKFEEKIQEENENSLNESSKKIITPDKLPGTYLQKFMA